MLKSEFYWSVWFIMSADVNENQTDNYYEILMDFGVINYDNILCDPIQQKVHVSCLLLKKNEIFALCNKRFNKLSNDTKFVNIEVILLKIQVLWCVNFLLFSLYFTNCFVEYLRINLADKMSLLLYWVTYAKCVVYWSNIVTDKIVNAKILIWFIGLVLIHISTQQTWWTAIVYFCIPFIMASIVIIIYDVFLLILNKSMRTRGLTHCKAYKSLLDSMLNSDISHIPAASVRNKWLSGCSDNKIIIIILIIMFFYFFFIFFFTKSACVTFLSQNSYFAFGSQRIGY